MDVQGAGFSREIPAERGMDLGATPKGGAGDADSRLGALDGWRGLSILLVLAAHLLPLGPKILELNEAAGAMGMALFFTLSGFLITRHLLRHDGITEFLIRRFFRIIPLAWLALAIALPMAEAPARAYLANLLFYANLPPQQLTDVASHFWSLCVEVQFYVGIALLVRLFGKRGLYLLPMVCVAVTAHRIYMGAYLDIVTWRRVDEILAGALLAMAFEKRFGDHPGRLLTRLNAYVLLVLLAACSHSASGFLNYLRPYVAAMLVGVTLLNPPAALGRLLGTKSLKYIALVSYAVYVTHHVLMYTWLGSGTGWIKYAKRIPLLAATFLLSHLSTFHYEKWFNSAGHRLSLRVSARRERERSLGKRSAADSR
jgi:peptidoglycan/LPS O-acetylase OafA/YrhL